MARKKTAKTPGPAPARPDLDAIRHKDMRKNIPTVELRDFVGFTIPYSVNDVDRRYDPDGYGPHALGAGGQQPRRLRPMGFPGSRRPV